jgi:non-specific serine/threonine protein kinase
VIEGLVLARQWAETGAWLARTLEVAAHVLVGTRGHAGRAARLFGVARAHRAAIGSHLPVPEEADRERALSRLRASLGDAQLAEELAAGAAMATEQAVEYALTALGAGRQDARVLRSVGASAEATILSPREREVVALVVQGLSNRDIAARLALSERTVESHVSNALRRLGIASRVRLAVWAVERGLTASAPRLASAPR